MVVQLNFKMIMADAYVYGNVQLANFNKKDFLRQVDNLNSSKLIGCMLKTLY